MDALLFGDQTTDYLSTLLKLLNTPQGPLTSNFLQRVGTTLRNEIETIPKVERHGIPSFSSIDELVGRYETSPDRNAMLDSTLTCLSQLLHFFYNTKVIGVCTGLFAASAVLSCDDLTSFLPLAIETVKIAFRVGLLVSIRAKEITSQPTSISWSAIISGTSEQEAEAYAKHLNERYALKHARKLYVSSVGHTTATFSGPSSSLQLLFQQEGGVGKSSTQTIPIRAPYHAPHIYNPSDLECLISHQTSDILKLYTFDPTKAVSFGKIASNSTLDLFKNCICQVLCERLRWTTILDDSAEMLSKRNTQLIVIGSSPHHGLVMSLKQRVPDIMVVNSFRRENAHLTSRELLDSNAHDNSKIAIVGMAGRFPGANSTEELWALLEQGIDTHRTIPPDRWDFTTHTDASGSGKNKSHTPFGCFLNNPGMFDHRFFNMSPREATQTDPMQRLALVTAYEAMESSGMVLNRTPSTQADRVATFYGQASDDWKETNTAQDIDTFYITGGIRAFGPGRINYHLGFQGPSYNVDTACSSSLAAIQLACTSLKAKECDTVLAGGLNVFTNPDIYSGLSKGQFLSKTGPCKTFDDEADGYCRGEGVGTIILKRLPDAIADRDPILGVITASATNHSAEAVSITRPHVETQEALFGKVLSDAQIKPSDVSYIEMHGTGTQAGDSVEMESVMRVFAPQGKPGRKRDNPLFLGSVKANAGHGEAVSGFTGLVKVLSMMRNDLIPPHIGIKTRLNRGFPRDLTERNVNIAKKQSVWLRPYQGKRHVLMNNFGAAGGNTALVMEDGPLRPQLHSDPRACHIITISAKTLSSLQKNVQSFLLYAEVNTSVDLPSLSYTTTARRRHYKYRVAVEVESQDELSTKLRTHLHASPDLGVGPPGIVFVFTGQGCQYQGMGETLMRTSKAFKDSIFSLDRISVSQGFPSFKTFICEAFNPASDPALLAPTTPIVTQLALVCFQIALAKLWISWGMKPSAVIGHSLGEYAAMNISGVLSAFDVIYLVGSRARLLQTHCLVGTHSMLAVKGSLKPSEVESTCLQYGVEVACWNTPQDIVFSGPTPDIEKLQTSFSATIKTKKLDVPFAFHSSQVGPILDEFETHAASVLFCQPNVPVISPLYGRTLSGNHEFGGPYLRRHCREAVNFVDSLQNYVRTRGAEDQLGNLWLEIGPQAVCSSMVKATLGGTEKVLPSLSRTEEQWVTLTRSLSAVYTAGVDVDWAGYHHDYEACVQVLPLPTYSFDEKRFWIDYKNDWMLNKGDDVTAAASTPSGISTTTVHRIVKQEMNTAESTAVLVAETYFHDSQLRDIIAGHLINGVGLCPSAIYADMALTLSQYGCKLLRPTSETACMNVRDMTTVSPFIVDLGKTKDYQTLEIEVTVD
ncbi:Conidial yellow pigment biosynthesis polyketide synthase [Lachnellula suecica]|uniref:Conidial yellow pigment biosynthesis polyketide synthase n=1 Tax=Lachnellula suecica TaxID=602035 RepID=A0A8T9CBQ2_9HELO|nr:Conidial yellow pigment biosynthesis polyketide synthase [Lachnellula suecica]